MLKGVIALMLGGIIGFSMAALVMVIPKNEEEIKKDWIEYKFKCEGNPEKCGQTYVKLK